MNDPMDIGNARSTDEAAVLSRVAAITGGGGWEVDLASGRLTVTREVHALLEVDPATFELTLETGRAFFDTTALARIDAAARGAIVEGQGWDLELPFVTARGRPRWIRTRGKSIRQGRRCTALVGTLEDITEARDARTRLGGLSGQLSERLRVVSDAAGLGLFTRDLQTGVGEWNEQTFRLYGFDPGGPVPTRNELLSHIHADDRERFLREWFDGENEAGPRSVEFRILRPDGVAHVYTHGVIERGADGRPARLFGVAMDVTRKRQAEEQLGEAHARLALATSSAGVGVFLRDAASDAGYWDPAVFRMFGLPVTDHPPARAAILAAVHVADRQQYLDAWRAICSSTQFLMTEIRTLHPDKSMHWLQIRGRNEGGRVAGAVIDVTAQKQAELQAREAQRQLHETLQRLELATSGSVLGIFERDLDRDQAYWSRENFALWGEPEQEQPPTWQRLLERVHPDDRDYFVSQWEKLRRSTDFVQSEFRISRGDGSQRWLMTRGKLGNAGDGNRQRVVGITLDITPMRAAQQERDALVERFDLIGRSMGLGLWEWDAAQQVTTWNDQMFALFGIDRAGSTGKHWVDLVHPDDVPGAQHTWLSALAGLPSYEFEYRIVRSDGEVRWLASRGRIVRDAQGRAQRVYGIEWDITEQKNAHAALLAKEAAERASAAKSTFLSRMSHELRTPLNAILGFAQILGLDRDARLGATERGYVKQIESAGWHLLTLINEVLDLSRVESGGARVDLTAVELAPLIDECIALTSTDAGQRSISIERAQAPGAPDVVLADATRLKQTLLNLLSNAVKYNREGGQVSVRVTAGGEQRARISVRDSGSGMTGAQLESLFQPFNRLGLESSPIEGTGLGLTISKMLVELMGGTIRVESTEGVGSEFTVELAAA